MIVPTVATFCTVRRIILNYAKGKRTEFRKKTYVVPRITLRWSKHTQTRTRTLLKTAVRIQYVLDGTTTVSRYRRHCETRTRFGEQSRHSIFNVGGEDE